MVKREQVRDWARTRFGIQEKFNEFLNWCFRKKTPIILIAAGALSVFFLFSLLKGLLLMALFASAGAASMLYNRFIRTSIGVELISLGVVIIGRLYGPVPAMAVGFSALFAAELLTGALQHKTIVSFIGILIMGYLTQFFAGMDVTATGIILVIIYDAIIIPGYRLLGSNPLRSAVFVATHIAFNVWVFTSIAPTILNILRIL